MRFLGIVFIGTVWFLVSWALVSASTFVGLNWIADYDLSFEQIVGVSYVLTIVGGNYSSRG